MTEAAFRQSFIAAFSLSANEKKAVDTELMLRRVEVLTRKSEDRTWRDLAPELPLAPGRSR